MLSRIRDRFIPALSLSRLSIPVIAIIILVVIVAGPA